MSSIRPTWRSILTALRTTLAEYNPHYKFNYTNYWEKRYRQGGNSGLGSYGVLSDFKTNIINKFIQEYQAETMIDFGCGDGQQIKNIKIKKYLGLDIAPSSVQMCQKLYSDDQSKSFILYHPQSFFNNFIKADLVICLDVLYHITSEVDLKKTLTDIFSCANNLVILYTNTENFNYRRGRHIVYWDTYKYLKEFKNFLILETIAQKYRDQSGADFIILKKLTSSTD
ncbi:MAG: class I SAM-dependent methyltransferase [Patescibacteria group bacterium]